jgi:pyridoxamine 5'-phosphate oxidase
VTAVDVEGLDPDPMTQFRAWLGDAEEVLSRVPSMTLATATSDGRPSARIVLLQSVDERGFVFFSNRGSRKGAELAENPRAALVFHWWELGRQVRVEGRVEELSTDESQRYWETRPRPSRIAAWASPQSQPIADRRALDDLVERAETRFEDGDVPLPAFWGGYRVVPAIVEFWLHRDNRLHDRARYTRTGTDWRRERLSP